MSTFVQPSGSAHAVASRYVVVGGAARRVVSHYLVTSGGFRLVDSFVPAFGATADTASVSGYSSTAKPQSQTVQSQTANITPTGGSTPYSYSWTRLDGDNRVTAIMPSSASCAFRATLNNEEADADFQWTVSDAYGSTATGTVSVLLSQSNRTSPQ